MLRSGAGASVGDEEILALSVEADAGRFLEAGGEHDRLLTRSRDDENAAVVVVG